jgi:hypothetical protein
MLRDVDLIEAIFMAVYLAPEKTEKSEYPVTWWLVVQCLRTLDDSGMVAIPLSYKNCKSRVR